MAYLTAEITTRSRRVLRRGERRRVSAEATCRRGTKRETVELRDLSPTGVRVRAIAPLRVGYTVFLRIGTMEALEARVVWTKGVESGCEFAHPLHPAVFDSLVPAT